jgi:hypothetical protein
MIARAVHANTDRRTPPANAWQVGDLPHWAAEKNVDGICQHRACEASTAVLIPTELDAQLSKAAQRSRMSKGEWVQRALEESLRRGGGDGTSSDPVARLGRLNAPTAGIEQMLSEIGAGRS